MSEDIRPTTVSSEQRPKKKSAFGPLFFDVILPSLILQYGEKWIAKIFHGYVIGAIPILVIALAFPLLHAVSDFLIHREKNFIAMLGVFNVLMTGGMAVLKVDVKWFPVKEAAVPLIIGVVVALSSFTENSLFYKLVCNDQIFKKDDLLKEVALTNHDHFFKAEIRKLGLLLSGSFLLSAILNYGLAYYLFIYQPIPVSQDLPEYGAILNEKIAQMTYYGYAVILLPSLLFLGFIFWRFSKIISLATNGRKWTEFLQDELQG